MLVVEVVAMNQIVVSAHTLVEVEVFVPIVPIATQVQHTVA
jgi:hypothetical protein